MKKTLLGSGAILALLNATPASTSAVQAIATVKNQGNIALSGGHRVANPADALSSAQNFEG